MKYTAPIWKQENVTLELNRIKAEPLNVDMCFKHPSWFSHQMLGLAPYKYQHMILRRYRLDTDRTPKRLMIVKPRQIGISVNSPILFRNKPFNDSSGQIIMPTEQPVKAGILRDYEV